MSLFTDASRVTAIGAEPPLLQPPRRGECAATFGKRGGGL